MSEGDLNMVTLMGNVGSDPEVRYTANGRAVSNFRIATTARWGKGDNKQERTDWHTVVSWADDAEWVKDNVKKGSRLQVEGRISYRSWEDRDGKKRYATEIVSSNIMKVGAKTEEEPPPIVDTTALDDSDIPF